MTRGALSVALFLATVAPAGTAALLLATRGERTSARLVRRVSLVGLCTALTAGVGMLVAAARGHAAAWGSFRGDVWRDGLVVGVLAVAVASLARVDSEEASENAALPAFLAGVTAGLCAILAVDTFSMAVFLIATTASVVVSRAARGGARGSLLVYAASDVAVVAGLIISAGGGMLTPLRPHGAAAALIAIGALLRLVPVLGTNDALERGVMRAQGLALLFWLAQWNHVSLLGVAAVVAAWSAWRALRDSSGTAASAAHAGLIVAGISVGTVAGAWGAIALAAALLLGETVRSFRAQATPTLGAAPLGASLPGAALVVAALLQRSLVRPWWSIAGIGAFLALVWLAQAGAEQFWEPGRERRAHVAWGVAPFGAIAAFVVAPGWALHGVASTAARAAGFARPLAGVVPTIPNDLGLAFAIALVAVMVAVPAARGATMAVASLPAVAAGPTSIAALPSKFRRATLLAELAAATGAIVLFWVGIQRGFL